ncbi:MAG: multidrug resistance efflux transporter family protein [Azospirillaceae bacterium]
MADEPSGARRAAPRPRLTEATPLWLLLLFGLVSAAFFSVTFVLNFAMSLEGGHWVWSAVLRYVHLLVLLVAVIAILHGPRALAGAFDLFRRHWRFWVVAGSFAVGLFYGPICFAADHARGWVVAATWQVTVIASPLVLMAMGYRMPKRGLAFSALVVAGVLLIHGRSWLGGLEDGELAYAVVPLLISAFAYPFGNQLLNGAKSGSLGFVPHIDSPLLGSAFVCILLLGLGSIPFWGILVAVTRPPAPSEGQVATTFVVAIVSGLLATSIFYAVRNASSDPFKIAAVDAAQALEVLMALLGEMALLSLGPPGPMALAGLFVLVSGLVAYALVQTPSGWHQDR